MDDDGEVGGELLGLRISRNRVQESELLCGAALRGVEASLHETKPSSDVQRAQGLAMAREHHRPLSNQRGRGLRESKLWASP
jgi:hypothetical protein